MNGEEFSKKWTETQKKQKQKETLLQNYLLNLISIAVDMLKEIDVYEVEHVDEVGKLVSSLAEYRKNNYIELPF